MTNKEARIDAYMMAYQGASLCGLFHQAFLSQFEKSEARGLDAKELAKRVGTKATQMSRWLSYPGNVSLETVARILAAMDEEVESITLVNRSTGARSTFPTSS